MFYALNINSFFLDFYKAVFTAIDLNSQHMRIVLLDCINSLNMVLMRPLMNIYSTSQMVESVTEHLQNGFQKGSAGIDSVTQKVGTGRKLVNSKFHYGALLSSRLSLYLTVQIRYRLKLTESDHSLSKSSATDLMGHVLIDWLIVASYVQLVHCANSTDWVSKQSWFWISTAS